MKEFFLNLKAKRREKGISLEDIHQRSRLPTEYLEAIESGQMEKLPRGYERIYLRRYAKEIGLNEEEVIRDYDLLTGRLASAATTDQASKLEKARKEPKPVPTSKSLTKTIPREVKQTLNNLNLDKIHNRFWFGIAALLVIVAGYFTFQKYVDEKNIQQVEIKEITISDLIEDFQEKDTVLTKPVSDNTISRTALKPQIFVELRALERTWIREIRDAQDTTDYILPSGFKRSVEAVNQVKFVLGRADGILINLNGDSLGILGRKDEVVSSLVLTTEGIAEKRIVQVKPKPAEPTEAISETPDSTMVETVPGDTLR